jgi:hypothetical protein
VTIERFRENHQKGKKSTVLEPSVNELPCSSKQPAEISPADIGDDKLTPSSASNNDHPFSRQSMMENAAAMLANSIIERQQKAKQSEHPAAAAEFPMLDESSSSSNPPLARLSPAEENEREDGELFGIGEDIDIDGDNGDGEGRGMNTAANNEDSDHPEDDGPSAEALL